RCRHGAGGYRGMATIRRKMGHLEIASGQVRPGFTTVFCPSDFPLTRLYNPTFAAAFSRKSDPSQMYLRKVARERWPVWAMMARSGTPAAAVARPARREWPA